MIAKNTDIMRLNEVIPSEMAQCNMHAYGRSLFILHDVLCVCFCLVIWKNPAKKPKWGSLILGHLQNAFYVRYETKTNCYCIFELMGLHAVWVLTSTPCVALSLFCAYLCVPTVEDDVKRRTVTIKQHASWLGSLIALDVDVLLINFNIPRVLLLTSSLFIISPGDFKTPHHPRALWFSPFISWSWSMTPIVIRVQRGLIASWYWSMTPMVIRVPASPLLE